MAPPSWGPASSSSLALRRTFDYDSRGYISSVTDPLGQTQSATELDAGLNLYRVSVPIGVIGVIFESRPDALVQIAPKLCRKTW